MLPPQGGNVVLTSCSERGTFWSFILCTPATAGEASAPAARRIAVFMVTVNDVC